MIKSVSLDLRLPLDETLTGKPLLRLLEEAEVPPRLGKSAEAPNQVNNLRKSVGDNFWLVV